MRPLLSRLAVRLLLFNVLLVFLPVAGMFSLRTLEQQLLVMQERSLVQQARVASAALGDGAVGDASAMLRRLGGSSESRIRVLDRAGTVVADSARGGAAPARQTRYSVSRGVESRRSFLYRIGAALWQPIDLLFDLRGKVRSEAVAPSRDALPGGVVRAALAGSYGATVRESAGQRSLTMYSALPIRNGGQVQGAVVVSQSTSRILRALWLFRVDLFRVVIVSVFVAAALSLLVSATIARPILRLRNEADSLLDRRGRLKGTFRGSTRRDEIGDLARALETLTARLERHLAFVEGFSADVSHEFKNPLASIRSSAELLAATGKGEDRELCRNIEVQVARLDRLLGGVREISRIDAQLESEAMQPVDIARVLREVTADPGGVEMKLLVGERPVLVSGSADRLRQALTNVVDNARSFSPPGGRVTVTLEERKGDVRVLVEDEGPGIPPEHLHRVFDRFFSFRPSEEGRSHDGLGLAITRAIVEGYGGSVAVSNVDPHGARFEVNLPVTA